MPQCYRRPPTCTSVRRRREEAARGSLYPRRRFQQGRSPAIAARADSENRPRELRHLPCLLRSGLARRPHPDGTSDDQFHDRSRRACVPSHRRRPIRTFAPRLEARARNDSSSAPRRREPVRGGGVQDAHLSATCGRDGHRRLSHLVLPVALTDRSKPRSRVCRVASLPTLCLDSTNGSNGFSKRPRSRWPCKRANPPRILNELHQGFSRYVSKRSIDRDASGGLRDGFGAPGAGSAMVGSSVRGERPGSAPTDLRGGTTCTTINTSSLPSA
jgi:hypothetical protein